jgi:hypothetical protein|tara:strand:+ start:113 stop:739 length:627 start_codon:yes stop_codon:yes gene_type:complete
MKKPIIILFLMTGLFGQIIDSNNEELGDFNPIGLNLFGGLSMGNLMYNDDEIEDSVETLLNIGMTIGAEKTFGPLKIGTAYAQLGGTVKTETNGVAFRGEDTYNYIVAYGVYPITVSEGMLIFGGMQIGYCIGGEAIREWGTESFKDDIDSDDIALDYGLLMVGELMTGPNIGTRTSLYYGLTDVAKDLEAELNFKNIGFGVSVIYKL